MPNWTNNQLDAINSTSGSILVSASAGSGKTTVLVERVMRRLTDEKNPVSADRLLIVTYTKAAASEMKDKIIKKLSSLIKENPYDLQLRHQQLKLQNAHISTIHSFCSQIVRENFYILGISKDYRIAEDGELNLIKENAIEELFDYMYGRENNTEFLNLVESFSGNKDDNALQKVILKLYEFLRSHPFPDVWMEEKLSYYNDTTDISSSLWGKIIFSYATVLLDFSLSIIEENMKIISQDETLSEKLKDVTENDHIIVSSILDLVVNKDWDKVYNAVQKIPFMRMPTIKGYKDNELKCKYANNRDLIKKTVASLNKYFIKTEEEYIKEISLMKPIVEEVFDLVKMFGEKYDKLKLQKNVLDFSDLEHLTLKLLVEYKDGKIVYTENAEKISSSFDEVMVDEYQDSNEVQDIIFRAISDNEKHLFVVGDVKQSIYSFRQAMPEIFISRRDKYPKYESSVDNYPGRIILENNFRSRREITDSVNFIFKTLMSQYCGDIDYNDDETLVCGRNSDKDSADDSNKVSLSVLEVDGDDDPCIVEADFIAKEIMRIKATKTVDDRKPQDGDFAILLRSSNKYAQIYVNRLKQWGISATSSSSDSFLTAREIVVTMNILRVIDNPLQDIPLLSALTSPLYGFTADELSEMRCDSRYKNVYSSLKDYSEQGKEKATAFLNDIERFRQYAVTLPVNELLNLIYEETFYPALLKGTSENNIPYCNILLLKEYAKEFEANGYKGLSSFINYIDNLEKQKKDLDSLKDAGEGTVNAVKVMSIHSSKGLEFPIVFLANTDRRFTTDTKENALIHKDLGFSIKIRDNENYIDFNTISRVATGIQIKRKEMSEELRVLYVALTRPKEELHMICCCKNVDSRLSQLAGKITGDNEILPFVVSTANKISDWLILCGLVHPNGHQLRSCANMTDRAIISNCPDWDIEIVPVDKENSEDNTENDISFEENNQVNEIDFEETDNDIGNIIKNRLDFVYPNRYVNSLPVKVSVSEISHRDSNEIFSKILPRPDFMSEKSMTPTERGTAVHNALQYIDFKSAVTDLKSEISRIVSKGFITEKQSSVIDLDKLEKFISSDIFKDILNSPKVYREFRFTTKIKAKEALENVDKSIENTEIILQGSVDLAYLKNDKLTVVDYKTDRVKNIEELKDRYSKQLQLYKEAMETVTPYKVDNCVIYSIHLGEFIKV